MTNEELFLKRDFDTLYTQNEAFIYYMCNKYLNLGIEYEELVGRANLAFAKCTKSFNPITSKWLTYLSKVLINEILMLNRKQKKWKLFIRLQDSLAVDIDGHNLTLEEVLEAEATLEDDVIDAIAIQEIRALMDHLGEKQQKVMLLFLQGKKQKEIGKLLGISQSYASRLIASSKTTLKKLYQQGA